MPLGIDPKVDIVFKKVFGSEENKPVLIDFIQPIIGETIAEVELLNPYSRREALDDKLSILDIKARLKDGRIVHIEMQMLVRMIYVPRAIYYWSATFSRQLKEGKDYTELKPVISIHILNEILFPEFAGYHRKFSIRSEDSANAKLTNLFALHTIELPKFLMRAEELTNPLEQWCYFLIHGEDLEPRAIPEQLRRPPIEQAVEVIEIMSHDPKERELYEDRLKARLDASANKKASFTEGKQLGLSEGKQLGLLEGIEMGLSVKFGPEGLNLLPKIRTIQDTDRLLEVQRLILLAGTLQEIEDQIR